MSRSTVSALLLLSLAAVAPARAQIAPDRPLSLEEAMGMALKKNLNLQISTNNNESQKEQIKITEARFDPTFTAGLTRGVNQSASNTSRLDGAQLEGSRSDTTSWRLGMSQLLGYTNGNVSANFNLGRSATNSTNALFNPQFSNGVSVNLDQPLLQNAGRAAAYYQLDRAKIGLTINNYNYTTQILNLIGQVENAYYSLVTARESLVIRQNSLRLAQGLVDDNKAKRASGTMIDLDVASAEVGLAGARATLLQSEQSVRDAEDTLISLISPGDYTTRPGPVKFQDFTDSVPSFAEAYKIARDRYPQTNSQEETIKQLQLDLENARRNLKPNLRLSAQLGYNAKATNQGYNDVFSNLIPEHGNTWQLGLNYTLPWGRKADKAQLRQSEIALTSGKLQLQQLEQDLMRQIRQNIGSIQTNILAVEIAAQRTKFSEQQYQQQKTRFDTGLSTTRLVLQAQDDLELARNTELGAKLTLRRAVSDLQRLQGTSFQRYNIQPPQ